MVYPLKKHSSIRFTKSTYMVARLIQIMDLLGGPKGSIGPTNGSGKENQRKNIKDTTNSHGIQK